MSIMSSEQLLLSVLLVGLFFVGLQVIRKRAVARLRRPEGNQQLTLISFGLAAYWSLLVFLPSSLGITTPSAFWLLLYAVATCAIGLGLRLLLRVLLRR